MKIFRFSIITSLMIGASVFGYHAKADDTQLYHNDYGVSHYTRYDLHKLENRIDYKNVQIPKINENQVQNLNSAKDSFYTDYKGQQLGIGDNWIVKNPNGQVYNYHGCHLMMAMTFNSNVNSILDGKIYLFYQKANQSNQGTKSWQCAGPLFKNNQEGVVSNQDMFNLETGEWSGSAVAQKDGSIRLFYTLFMKETTNKYPDNQHLSTAVVFPKITKHGIEIQHNKTTDRRVIFSADGKYYQAGQQISNDPNHSKNDNFTLRDPQIVFNGNKKYLIFEANTGTKFGYEGENTLYNTANLGGNASFQKSELTKFASNQTLKTKTAYDNSAIGIMELTNDYKLKKLMKPLVIFSGVDDETERPSLIQYKGRFYLFTCMHGWHLASDKIPSVASILIGMSSKTLTGKYTPLNGSGLVLYENAIDINNPIQQRTFSYSYSVNQATKSPFIINSYIGSLYANTKLNQYSTLSPSLLLDVNGNKTNIQQKALAQGQFVK